MVSLSALSHRMRLAGDVGGHLPAFSRSLTSPWPGTQTPLVPPGVQAGSWILYSGRPGADAAGSGDAHACASSLYWEQAVFVCVCFFDRMLAALQTHR